MKRCLVSCIIFIDKWKKLGQYQRDRPKEDIELIEKKKAIFNKINSRYDRILNRAYGDKCIRCLCKDKNAYKMNCCKSSMCKFCINGLKEQNEAELFKVICPNCAKRPTTFRSVDGVIETLSTLCDVKEQGLEEDKDDNDFLNVSIAKKPIQKDVPVEDDKDSDKDSDKDEDDDSDEDSDEDSDKDDAKDSDDDDDDDKDKEDEPEIKNKKRKRINKKDEEHKKTRKSLKDSEKNVKTLQKVITKITERYTKSIFDQKWHYLFNFR